jgi:DNA-directed RNA polymerase
MSLDEELSPYVNLVPTDLPGDLYMLIAEKVWHRLKLLEDKVPGDIKEEFDTVLATITKLQKDYDEAPPGSEQKVLAYQEVQTYRNNNRLIREALFPVYWRKITDKKLLRKICKRPAMTLGYGASPYGFSQQIWDDSRELSPYLKQQEKLWASQLGRLIHETAMKDLRGPGALLRLFESIADIYNEKHEHLAWNSPITNFPVVQNYRQPISNRTKLRYGDKELYVVVENWEEATLDKDSQRLGASPNIVHSLDAVHMMMVLDSADFDIAAIHDSWGATPGDISSLFNLIREKFVELYQTDPLLNILTQLECDNMLPKRGTLDLTKVLESDYAFS